MLNRLELLTLPIRTIVLLILLYGAYSFGYGEPVEEWRKEAEDGEVVARYTNNGRPWQIFYDRDRDRRWDMWIDERSGPPVIVSVDDDFDGRPDRNEDEFGNPLSAWDVSQLRAKKTFTEFLNTPRQWQYLALALMLYTLMEMAVRSLR
jgi:hypothetical protein